MLWEGFSWRWYISAWHNEQVKDVTIRSLVVATCASGISTVLATMAALGTTRETETLDGSHNLQVPSGTQSGTRFRLRGKGVPALDGRGRGDHYIEVRVLTPQSLDTDQRELFEKLAEVEGEPVEDRGLFDRVRDIFGG